MLPVGLSARTSPPEVLDRRAVEQRAAAVGGDEALLARITREGQSEDLQLEARDEAHEVVALVPDVGVVEHVVPHRGTHGAEQDGPSGAVERHLPAVPAVLRVQGHAEVRPVDVAQVLRLALTHGARVPCRRGAVERRTSRTCGDGPCGERRGGQPPSSALSSCSRTTVAAWSGTCRCVSLGGRT
ncbi:hypothetical protein N868_14880 [Cellulomonas carbonis T26]|uniref:Uncharacterized protein n=1 Tax=Cellulomonas carbonis T26 TaxID=947969 RepID=A0A0A0BYX9_9CELL|nr:hypothetical protein N868_14880 [Cellulomonas carbonis T26]